MYIRIFAAIWLVAMETYYEFSFFNNFAGLIFILVYFIILAFAQKQQIKNNETEQK